MSTQPPPEEDFESHRAAPASGAGADRPDWLVGPDEGAASEVQRGAEKKPAGAPRLARPSLPLKEQQPREKAPAKPVAWTAAASSLPTLRRRDGEAPPAPRPAFPAPRPEPTEAWPGGPVTTSGSATGLPAATQPATAPADAFPGDEFAMDDLPVAGGGDTGPAGAARHAMTPLKEPWWAIALDALRSNRLLQAVIALGAVGFLVWKMWPSPVPSLHISKIHANPEGFDGRVVELHGRVGEVYPVGGGYAFYLHQGSDTIVVFTRSRVPSSRQKVSVLGSVSTGYLDGIARPALFEETTP